MRQSVSHLNDSVDLVELVSSGIQEGDLDAHLACLALTYTFHKLDRTPFSTEIDELQHQDPKKGKERIRPHDTAVIGVRLHLGWSLRYQEEFPDLCLRELRREVLPPLETVHTNPRLLLGIAAGANSTEACSKHQRHLWETASEFCEKNSSPWTYILGCWSRRILASEDEYAQVAARLVNYLLSWDKRFTARDCAATLWVLSNYEIFMPNTSLVEFDRLEALREDLESTVAGGGVIAGLNGGLDSTLLYAAYCSRNRAARGRRHAVQATLDVIEIFDQAARRLATARRKGKSPFVIEDEYDVQDLFYVMLLSALPDLEPEDPTIKHAGSSKKIDFVSREGRIGVEIKCVRANQKDGDVSDDLKIDIESYHIHPACKTLINFVYDPNRRILEPRIIERDLSGTRGFNGRIIELITRIRPK